MEVVLSEMDHGVKLQLTGEVDLHNSPGVREKLLEAAERKVALVLVDLTGVHYIDSSGLATLVECLQHLSSYGGKLALVGATKTTRDVFAIARLDKIFTFYDDEKEALAHIPAN
jgi:anti-anti-sigma factor